MDNPGCEHLEAIRTQIQVVQAQLEALGQRTRGVLDVNGLEALEREAQGLSSQLSDLLVAVQVQVALCSTELRTEEEALVKAYPKKLHSVGWREVELRCTSGHAVKVKARYFSRRPARGRKRPKGCYPGLVVLGIYDRSTPGLAADVGLMVTALGSLAEAQQALVSQGKELDIKTVRTLSRRLAQRARQTYEAGHWPVGETLAGRRVVLSLDGGRLRIRKPKRGRKTAKRRHRYTTDWREPKLMVIYVVDKEGRADRRECPWLDGTLRGPEAVFALIRYYLSRLGVGQADTLVVIADGARWIWKRVAELVADCGLRAEQVYEVVDFYHVVEHLGIVANAQAAWTEGYRRAWIKTQRQRLLTGYLGQVLDALTAVCRRKRSPVLQREYRYFHHNRHRLNYAKLKANHLPIGSGAVESAIRRVVNLRLKGAGMFWYEETAQEMLMLRSYYKAGRWELLKKLAFFPTLPLAA
ncbi:MAG: hypothetical protein U1F76_15625 [Candidatus Competibacteraceae bacterium]